MKYHLVLTAMKYSNGVNYIRSQSCSIDADNIYEARGKHTVACHKVFPDNEGWRHHGGLVTPTYIHITDVEAIQPYSGDDVL